MKKNNLKNKEKKKIIKYILLALVILVFVGVILWLFPLMKNITTTQGQIEFKEKIDSMGFLGALILFGLQFAQIFFVVLPGEPLEVLAGMCYGPLWGTIFIFFSVFLITTFIVVITRKFGEKLINNVWDEKKIKKIKNSKVFKNAKKIEILMIILFLIPGTPKDLLTYIGAILPINPIKFILISTFVRFPSVISSTLAGANIASGNFKSMIIVYVVTIIITALAIFISTKMDKNTKEAMDVLKK